MLAQRDACKGDAYTEDAGAQTLCRELLCGVTCALCLHACAHLCCKTCLRMPCCRLRALCLHAAFATVQVAPVASDRAQ
eukprot:15475865-Alexandrium_andersonii.AAC.1